MPEIFSINIAFTLAGLPVLVFVFLSIMNQLNKWGKAGLILLLSLLMPILEKLAEVIGWFEHSEKWEHLYTSLGYLIFFTLIYTFYAWLKRRNG
jgi:hypothetical protein